MAPDPPLWPQQCEAARSIRERFGVEKALGYLLGEKLMNHLRAADYDARMVSDLPRYAEDINGIFSHDELRRYFSGSRRIGALGHVLDEAGHEMFRAAGAVDEAVDTAAQDAILFERMRRLVLKGTDRSSA